MSTTILQTTTRTAPERPAALRPLFERPVLLATDGANAASAAVRFTSALARKRRASPQVVTVLPPAAPGAAPVTRLASRADEEAEAHRRAEWRDHVRGQLHALAAPGQGDAWPLDVEVGSPATAITRTARTHDVGSIVIGLRPHGTLDRIFRDETALLVARNAAVPVLAIAPTLTDLPRRVIAAVDFSRASLGAVRAAVSVLAEGGTLLLVHVQPEIDFTPEQAEGYGVIYSQGVASAFARLQQELVVPPGVTVQPVLLRGNATTELLALADRAGADLIAVGSQRHGPGRLSLGSVTRSLVREGRVSLLVTPPPDHPVPGAAADRRAS